MLEWGVGCARQVVEAGPEVVLEVVAVRMLRCRGRTVMEGTALWWTAEVQSSRWVYPAKSGVDALSAAGKDLWLH